jgi:hypothetical protein
MLYLFILCVNCSTDINLSSELFALSKRLFRSVRALMRLLTLHKLFSLLIWAKSSAVLPWPLSLGCVFIRTLSVEGVASELSLTVMSGLFFLFSQAFSLGRGAKTYFFFRFCFHGFFFLGLPQVFFDTLGILYCWRCDRPHS